MKRSFPLHRFVCMFCIVLVMVVVASCSNNSSPEGRMSEKIENLQKQMIDSMRQQNRAILDSLSAIRAELIEIKAKK